METGKQVDNICNEEKENAGESRYFLRKRKNKPVSYERKKRKLTVNGNNVRCVVCGDVLKEKNEKELCGEEYCLNELNLSERSQESSPIKSGNDIENIPDFDSDELNRLYNLTNPNEKPLSMKEKIKQEKEKKEERKKKTKKKNGKKQKQRSDGQKMSVPTGVSSLIDSSQSLSSPPLSSFNSSNQCNDQKHLSTLNSSDHSTDTTKLSKIISDFISNTESPNNNNSSVNTNFSEDRNTKETNKTSPKSSKSPRRRKIKPKKTSEETSDDNYNKSKPKTRSKTRKVEIVSDDESEYSEDIEDEDIEDEDDIDEEYDEELDGIKEQLLEKLYDELTDEVRYEETLRKIIEKTLENEMGDNISKEMSETLEKIMKGHFKRQVSLEKIIKSDLSYERKLNLLEDWLILKNTSKMTENYKEYNQHLRNQLWDYEDVMEDLNENERNVLLQLKNKSLDKDLSLQKILSSDLPEELSLIVLEKYVRLQRYSSHSEEYQDLVKDIRQQLDSWKPEYRESFQEMSKQEHNASYEERLFKSDLPVKVKSHIYRELKYLREMSDSSTEYSKQKYWLDYALSLPTKIKQFPVKKEDPIESKHQFESYIRQKLDQSCFGMSEVKELILDYVFLKISNPSGVPPILVLVGPPGIGKTTLARSLAESLGLDFIPINMGGVHDTSKLMGHSKTYIGAIPGEIIRGMSKCSSRNPMIYLDEVDKIPKNSDDVNGPEGCLTHILDPSQNNEFVDEYLGFPYNLSEVLWVATVNHLEYLNRILADRLFPIHMSGYNFAEKIQMARKYLLPKIFSNLGFNPDHPPFTFSDSSLRHLLNILPEEPGVRSFQKHLEFLLNRLNRLHNVSSSSPLTITSDLVDQILKSLPKTNDPTRLWII